MAGNLFFYTTLFFSFFILFATTADAGTQHKTISGLNTKDFESHKKEQIEWQHNPFVKPANEVPVGELRLTGIVYSKTKAAAIINDQIVEKGDKIGSHEVVSIEKSAQVVLRTENGLFRLKMKGGLKK